MTRTARIPGILRPINMGKPNLTISIGIIPGTIPTTNSDEWDADLVSPNFFPQYC